MSAIYNNEFVRFIKNLLINACYSEYCRQVNHEYSDGNTNTSHFKYALIEYKNDKAIWDNVFYKFHDLFIYYLHLSTDYKGILLHQPRIVYEQLHLTSTYLQLTFQEYVDEQINFQKVGYREYMNFAKSMQEYKFKAKMVDKYREDTETRNLKNHLIYIIHLHLSKAVENSKYFTIEEKELMELTINPITYFEYIDEYVQKRQNQTEICNFSALEGRVFEYINKKI
jgi:hypothetical protein